MTRRGGRTLHTGRRYRRLRRGYLARHPYCRTCRAKRITMASAEVDHIVPLADGGAFWDTANWQALCERCHDEKTAGENTGRHVAEVPGRAAWRKRIGDYRNGQVSRL